MGAVGLRIGVDGLDPGYLECLDGGRSRAIRRSLERPLRAIRSALGAEVALVLSAAPGSHEQAYVLASGAEAGCALPLPNEPLRLGHWSYERRPASRSDLLLSSAMRSYELELPSALVMPWSASGGRCWLIVGMVSRGTNGQSLELNTARPHVAKLRDAYVLAGLRGAARLQRDVTRAVEEIGGAAVKASDLNALLDSITASACMLLGTSSSYISLFDQDGNRSISVARNIRTEAFRRYRNYPEQGLGGLAYHELRAVISVNYPEDRRLLDPPIEETLREGLLSAICVPLIIDGQVFGLLYVANRRLTPFTEADAELLERFARHATLGINRAEVERHRLDAVRQTERNRLAFYLHDSVVRSLLEIGYDAEFGVVAKDDAIARSHFERIGRAAGTSLETIRGLLTEMVNTSTHDAPKTVRDVVEALRTGVARETITRVFEITGKSAGFMLPHHAAAALISIGHEAIYNAELHSDASVVEVQIGVREHDITLRVRDDGNGASPEALSHALDASSGHFGLRRMRRAATSLGGRLSLSRDEDGGLRVEAEIPLR